MFKSINDLNNIDIILASQSPRRRDLLAMIGLKFKIKPGNVEEKNHDNLKPIDYAMQNAKAKAFVISEKYPDSLVVSADTIVVKNNIIIEKPKDRIEAFTILNSLNGENHMVFTAFGITIKNKNISCFDYEETKVTFRKLSEKNIRDYIDTGEPFDKAGGYGAQGLGALLIDKVDGCFYNVVGFPLSKFYKMLNMLFDK